MEKNPFKKTLMNSHSREWVRRRIEQYVLRRIANVIVHPVEYDFYGEKHAVLYWKKWNRTTKEILDLKINQ